MATTANRMATLADETLDRIAHRTNVIWKKWGPEDYPSDRGVAFRNKIFLFGYWMQLIFRDACSKDPEAHEEWICKNATTFLKLTSEDFTQCIGIALIYMEAFWLHLVLQRQLSGYEFERDRAIVQHHFKRFGKQLDWIFNIHGIPSDAAKAFHDLVLEHRGEQSYSAASKEQLGRLLLETPLGWSDASSPEEWDRWACAAGMSSRNQLDNDPKQSEYFCNRVFSQF